MEWSLYCAGFQMIARGGRFRKTHPLPRQQCGQPTSLTLDKVVRKLGDLVRGAGNYFRGLKVKWQCVLVYRPKFSNNYTARILYNFARTLVRLLDDLFYD